ncbi:LysM peptidoglycan-binding domain-containing M23 family metallopeptidase [Jeongeupia chitinilytica]|uniref:Lipoprotein n=1 Tax=Jeongeupia chitinilytica TaxID=1041641 RepID=A0ABQ3GW87_9NEIS|nr:LysM peptidoglycan-binding domain-containing M23 family metallopeptidase [Jeongeupia chitinilytica]GHD58164.1 lipoprotein [Jeongeupia chitinilytica]
MNLSPFLARIVPLAVAFLLTACAGTPDAGPAPAGYYRVAQGDTLWRIATKNSRSVAEIKRWNKLSDNDIQTGQLLRVTPPGGSPASSASSSKPVPAPAKPATVDIRLAWPVPGQVVARYNGSTMKGIALAVQPGEPVKAAAGGKVVYVGGGIRAYGNLIVIKHDARVITVYAYNRELLVKDGASVQAGQVIAKAGGTAGVPNDRMHFEVRVDGKAVDPSPYLPDR